MIFNILHFGLRVSRRRLTAWCSATHQSAKLRARQTTKWIKCSKVTRILSRNKHPNNRFAKLLLSCRFSENASDAPASCWLGLVLVSHSHIIIIIRWIIRSLYNSLSLLFLAPYHKALASALGVWVCVCEREIVSVSGRAKHGKTSKDEEKKSLRFNLMALA